MVEGRPLFSIVSAVHDVEPYLPDFIRSIDAQGMAPGLLEVITVDDGSTDGSRAILEAWRDRVPYRVVVLHQENAGQASARNAGLRVAAGEWVTFTDPDDMLDTGFLASAAAFATAHPDIDVMASRVLLLDERRGRIRDRHPRRRQFAAGERIADLEREPNVFTGSSTVSLFRLDRVRGQGIEFDPLLRPTFEDGHFACRMLLSLDRPRIGLLTRSRYLYRKRMVGTSTLDRSFEHPGRYTTFFERGLLDLVRRARERGGTVPAWLAQVLVYELSWYLSENDAASTRLAVPDDLRERFLALFGETARAVDPAVVRDHRVRRLKPAWIDLLVHGFRDEPWCASVASVTAVDRAMRLRRVVYRHTGPIPEEEVRIDGRPQRPAFEKTASLRCFGEPRMAERILWLPEGGRLEVRAAGRELRIETALESRGLTPPDGALPPFRTPGRVGRLRRAVGPRRRLRQVAAWARRLTWRAGARLVYGRSFGDAWVLQDRLQDADDNGERLFEHLRANHPEINTWFVLEAGTPDWRRLAAAGERRLVAYGSRRWKALMLNASWLLSSHADLPVVRPAPVLAILGEPTWKFAFLQHGVIKDDLSPWLNQRGIDLFVVSTGAELASVAGDGTGYAVTAKETRLTGLPRFDRLLERGRVTPPDLARLVLVAPTWRAWLTQPLERGSQRRDLGAELPGSDYLRRWMAILRSPEIEAVIRARGWRLGFMPHPNLQQILPSVDLPEHVERLSFAGSDVQGLYARTALLVTDYSSVAFNTAYLDRPVVYYQFDRDRVLSGAHVGRRGYFDYERDGFGPVATDHDAAVAAILAAIERGPRPAPEHGARISATFPVRDGGACERVVDAVRERSRPWRPDPGGGA
ncbi:MAG: CDP-glycerol glycerophosphotransferase family protein [Chloroflexota bacterium]